jgi:molecular chaperone HscA
MGLLQIFDPQARPTPIGIDLGTTNSLVAWVGDGMPMTVLDCDNDPLVPSVVAYLPDGQVIVGKAARDLALKFPRETIVSVKRFMGRGADDAETRRLGPYEFATAREGESNTVRFVVHGKTVTPVEVSAEILKALKQGAEEKLQNVGGVVITVPAYFDDAQRQATKDAGRLAGLEVLRLLNEPTAAALAYGLDRGKTTGTFAVYDLGGGTFDITILTLDDGVFQVRSTGGDSQLGGDDMDRALADVLLREAGWKMPGHEGDGAPASPEALRAAITAAKHAKHDLTLSDTAHVELDLAGRRITRDVTRAEFDALVKPIVERTGIACRRALKDAGVKPEELDGVVLVGGSTRVPFVRAFVKHLFKQEPLTDIDPDQVVALGAAVQADILAGTQQNEALIFDVTPLSLGIETMGGLAEKIIPRNTTIPSARAQQFTTYVDGQTGFDLHVVQGERELARDCRSLARFTLRGIPGMVAGAARLELTFRVDADGLLEVTAKEITTGVETKVDVKPSYGLTDEDVERMLVDSFEHAEEDIAARQRIERTVEAERVISATSDALAADSDLLDEDERAEVDGAIKMLRDAIAKGDARAIQLRVEALDRATTPLAERRMNRAIAGAMRGRAVEEVEKQVESSKGVDAHVAQHAERAHDHGGH